jgi:hypothetical protein
VYCEACDKYKPPSAFERFRFEERFLERPRILREINSLEREDVEWYKSNCNRCRARTILMVFDKRVERMDETDLGLHTRTSLGLDHKRGYNRDRSGEQRKLELEAARGKSLEEYHAVEYGYESWVQVYERLEL